YSTLSGFTWTHPNSSGVVTEMETISVSAAPLITNVESYYATLYNNHIIPLSGTVLTLIGQRFQYTTNVYLSSNTPDFYGTEELVDRYTHYAPFSGYKLEPELYSIPSSNTLTINIPALTASGR